MRARRAWIIWRGVICMALKYLIYLPWSWTCSKGTRAENWGETEELLMPIPIPMPMPPMGPEGATCCPCLLSSTKMAGLLCCAEDIVEQVVLVEEARMNHRIHWCIIRTWWQDQ